MSERITEQDKAASIQAACQNGQAVCVSSDKEKKTVKPPKLFDLTTLQREANRLYGSVSYTHLAMGIHDKALIFVLRRILTAQIKLEDGTFITPDRCV